MHNFTTELDMLTTTEYIYEEGAAPCNSEPAENFASYFIPILYSVVIIFGLLGNALVVLILIKYKKFKSMTDIYLLNLCITDLLFVFSLPVWAYTAAHEWIFGNPMCKLFSGLFMMGFYGGSFFIILLTIDRYLAIVHAVAALKARTVFYGILTSGFTWGLALLAAVPNFVFTESQSQGNKSVCTPRLDVQSQRAWNVFLTLKTNLIGLVFPMIVMIFCYARIISTLMTCRNDKKNRKSKAVKLIFIIMIIYFLFWAPFNIALFLWTFQDTFGLFHCDKMSDMAVAMDVTKTLAMAHCCVNPVIYAFAGEKFRKYIANFFRKHIALHLPKYCLSLYSEPLERSLSTYSQSTGEHEISALM